MNTDLFFTIPCCDILFNICYDELYHFHLTSYLLKDDLLTFGI